MDLTIRQGDTYPPLDRTILDTTNSPLDLTGASVTFTLRALTSNNPLTLTGTTTVTDELNGGVQYAWGAGDTATPGIYMGEFHATLAGGATYTDPNDGYLTISVEESLTTTGGAQIVSLGELKDHLKIRGQDRARDAQLMRMISYFGPVVESIVGHVTQKQFDELYDSTGQPWLMLRQTPVISVESVEEWRGPIDYNLSQVATPGQGTIYSVLVEPTVNRIVRRSAGGGVIPFPALPQSIRVVYTAGRTTVPANITLGMLELIRLFWTQTQQSRGGPTNPGESADDTFPTTEMLGFAVPGKVREILAPSKKVPVIA